MELEAKIEALQAAINNHNEEHKAYQTQIDALEKQLEDLNKPKLYPAQFDELREAVEEAVGQFDFDDCNNYDVDFDIKYDNRIAIESMSFHQSDELARAVYMEIRELFAEIKEDDNQLNQD